MRVSARRRIAALATRLTERDRQVALACYEHASSPPSSCAGPTSAPK